MTGRFLWRLGEICLPLLATVAAVALGLRLLGALPSMWLQPPVTTFASLEEAERALGERVWLPVYFPEYLEFPPGAIEVEREPVPRVFLSFRGRGDGEGEVARLAITQVLSAREAPPLEVLPPDVLTGQAVDIAGVVGVMAVEADGYRIYWRARGRHLLLTGCLPAEELLRIARSLR